MSTTVTPSQGNQLWGIYYTDREYARLLGELGRPVTLLGAFELLSARDLLEEEMENLEGLLETPRREAVYAHFAHRFLNQSPSVVEGIILQANRRNNGETKSH